MGSDPFVLSYHAGALRVEGPAGDEVLHAEGVVERTAEGLVDVGRGGLDGAVQIQVADALCGEQDALHDLLVVHRRSSLFNM